MFPPHPRVKLNIVGSLRDREVACSASNHQGSNFVSCVWRTVSSHSSHHPKEVLLAQFSLYVHKCGLKPDSFHFQESWISPSRYRWNTNKCLHRGNWTLPYKAERQYLLSLHVSRYMSADTASRMCRAVLQNWQRDFPRDRWNLGFCWRVQGWVSPHARSPNYIRKPHVVPRLNQNVRGRWCDEASSWWINLQAFRTKNKNTGLKTSIGIWHLHMAYHKHCMDSDLPPRTVKVYVYFNLRDNWDIYTLIKCKILIKSTYRPDVAGNLGHYYFHITVLFRGQNQPVDQVTGAALLKYGQNCTRPMRDFFPIWKNLAYYTFPPTE